jgi:mono/diheme cytochrome c family protein
MKWKVSCFLALFFFVLVACQSDQEIEFARYYSGGSVIYQSKCQNCHGSDGKGLAALIPALTQIKTDKAVLACLVKYGSKETLNPLNKTFGNQMPATDLPSVDIAKVLTYVTNSFGNKMGTINAEQVEKDLKGCK